MALVPRNETIHLQDTIQLPMQCIKDLQSKHTITLRPIADEVASHIITDKLWLQENILCLFSNAVKYSNGGAITLEICLDKDPPAKRKSSKQPFRTWRRSEVPALAPAAPTSPAAPSSSAPSTVVKSWLTGLVSGAQYKTRSDATNSDTVDYNNKMIFQSQDHFEAERVEETGIMLSHGVKVRVIAEILSSETSRGMYICRRNLLWL